jgi:hypothetical protein
VTIDTLAVLARSPRTGVDVILARGSGFLALVLMAIATVASALVASRVASEVDVNELFFGRTRQPLVQIAIDQLGPERTSVVVYLVQQSFIAVVILTALSPLFVWLLGSSAIHASAHLAGYRRPYRPMLVLFAYATALALVPANAASLALGVGESAGARVASLFGYACLVWLGVIAYRAIRAHYAVPGDRAIRILVVAIVLFYLVPLVLIAAAVVALIVAAIMLGYV